ncbi:protein CASP-like [Montipora capricornis]|uniref:protein CASP-like n=1 Tax=Montipora capricornis TaxID=246305 RepID=UPI0035F1E000
MSLWKPNQVLLILKTLSINVLIRPILYDRGAKLRWLVVDIYRYPSLVTSTSISRLEDLLASKTTALRELECKLEAQHNYEEIKRELSILKAVEFSTSGSEGDREKKESSPKSLEMLLLDKNKRLQSENTSLKVENVELAGTLQACS